MPMPRRLKQKVPRYRNRSIVPDYDDDEISKINVERDRSADLFENLLIFSGTKERTSRVRQPLESLQNLPKLNLVKKVAKKPSKKPKKTYSKAGNPNKADSLPSPLKLKVQEINDIDENFELHITTGTNASSKLGKASYNSNNFSAINKTGSSATNIFGTSTPSIFGRIDRKPCLEQEDVSLIEASFNRSLIFENSENNDKLESDYHNQLEISQSHGEEAVVNRISAFDIFSPSKQISSRLIRGEENSANAHLSRDSVSKSNFQQRKSEFLTEDPHTSETSAKKEITEEFSSGTSEFYDTCGEELRRLTNVVEAVEEDDDEFVDTNDKFSSNLIDTCRNKQKTCSRLSFGDVCSPYILKRRAASVAFDPKTIVFHACNQEKPISWHEAFFESMLNSCVKIGEGTYGEVFKTKNVDRDSVALKIIPIEGSFCVNDEKQKTFEEILPEILIAIELSNLKENELNRTPNFVDVKKVHCIRGSYPKRLLQAWKEYKDRKVSENDCPDMFDDEQLFIVFEFGDGGIDLENVHFSNGAQAKSVIMQISLGLAIAETVLEFEHRDLHIGNVLVKTTKEKFIEYVFHGCSIKVSSHGVHVFIIDFTNSRLHKDACTIFTNLANDEALFEGEGDYQFDIYRLMRELNENEWKHYEAKTNLLWLHYLLDKMIKVKTYRGKMLGQKWRTVLETLSEELFNYTSCEDFVVNNVDFFKESYS